MFHSFTIAQFQDGLLKISELTFCMSCLKITHQEEDLQLIYTMHGERVHGLVQNLCKKLLLGTFLNNVKQLGVILTNNNNVNRYVGE